MAADPAERNQAVFRRLQEEVIVQGRLELAPEIFAPTFHATRTGLSDLMALRGGGEAQATGDVYEQFAAGYRVMTAIFASQSRVIEELQGSGNTVWARWRIEATHAGPFLGLAPTGRRVSWTEVGFLQFDSDGRITSGWFLADELRLAQQLGMSVRPAT